MRKVSESKVITAPSHSCSAPPSPPDSHSSSCTHVTPGKISEPEVVTQFLVLLGAGIGTSALLDAWAGHEFPIMLALTLFGSLISYIYSAPPLKLKQSGWIGNYALGSSYIALPWWAGQVRRWLPGGRGACCSLLLCVELPMELRGSTSATPCCAAAAAAAALERAVTTHACTHACIEPRCARPRYSPAAPIPDCFTLPPLSPSQLSLSLSLLPCPPAARARTRRRCLARSRPT